MSTTNPLNNVTVNTGYTSGTIITNTGDAKSPDDESSSISNDQFLKLLLATLKNQDPSNAVETKDLMAQTAQLAQMEASQKMQTAIGNQTTSVLSSQAIGMIGKKITAVGTSGGDISGVVTSVTTGTAGPTLKIGDMEVPLASVKEVASA
jgi:flagellar basal-body rod modification protein FlgD